MTITCSECRYLAEEEWAVPQVVTLGFEFQVICKIQVAGVALLGSVLLTNTAAPFIQARLLLLSFVVFLPQPLSSSRPDPTQHLTRPAPSRPVPPPLHPVIER